MQAMEHELGFSLLDASSHGVTLTNYGKNAVPVFRKMIKEYDGFLDHMRRKYPIVQVATYTYQPQPLYDDLMSCKLD